MLDRRSLFYDVCQNCEDVQGFCPISAHNEIVLGDDEKVECPLWMFWNKYEDKSGVD